MEIYRSKTLNLFLQYFKHILHPKLQCTGHFPIADGPALSVLHFIPGQGGSRFSLATSYISVFFFGGKYDFDRCAGFL
jgi:hypothetical protein